MITEYAVFAVTQDLERCRVTKWLDDYDRAFAAWLKLDAKLQDGAAPDAVRYYAVRPSTDPDWFAARNGLPAYPGEGRYQQGGKRHWSKLPPVKYGFERVPDDDRGRRMIRCTNCGHVLPSLGMGYHNRGGVKCSAQARGETVQWE